MSRVRVKVIQAFDQHWAGDEVDLEPVDASIKARQGLVSLLHGTLYSTRDMMAGYTASPATVTSFLETPQTVEPPVKRKRGRPRKVKE